jgi:hypothetical protein
MNGKNAIGHVQLVFCKCGLYGWSTWLARRPKSAECQKCRYATRYRVLNLEEEALSIMMPELVLQRYISS